MRIRGWVTAVATAAVLATTAAAAAPGPRDAAQARAAVQRVLGPTAQVKWDPRRGLVRVSGLSLRLPGRDLEAAEGVLRRLNPVLWPGLAFRIVDVDTRASKYGRRVDGELHLERMPVADVRMTVEFGPDGAIRAVAVDLPGIEAVDRRPAARDDAALRDAACREAKRLSRAAVCDQAPVRAVWFLGTDRVMRRGAQVGIPTATLDHAWDILVDGSGAVVRTIDRAKRSGGR